MTEKPNVINVRELYRLAPKRLPGGNAISPQGNLKVQQPKHTEYGGLPFIADTKINTAQGLLMVKSQLNAAMENAYNQMPKKLLGNVPSNLSQGGSPNILQSRLQLTNFLQKGSKTEKIQNDLKELSISPSQGPSPAPVIQASQIYKNSPSFKRINQQSVQRFGMPPKSNLLTVQPKPELHLEVMTSQSIIKKINSDLPSPIRNQEQKGRLIKRSLLIASKSPPLAQTSGQLQPVPFMSTVRRSFNHQMMLDTIRNSPDVSDEDSPMIIQEVQVRNPEGTTQQRQSQFLKTKQAKNNNTNQQLQAEKQMRMFLQDKFKHIFGQNANQSSFLWGQIATQSSSNNNQINESLSINRDLPLIRQQDFSIESQQQQFIKEQDQIIQQINQSIDIENKEVQLKNHHRPGSITKRFAESTMEENDKHSTLMWNYRPFHLSRESERSSFSRRQNAGYKTRYSVDQQFNTLQNYDLNHITQRIQTHKNRSKLANYNPNDRNASQMMRNSIKGSIVDEQDELLSELHPLLSEDGVGNILQDIKVDFKQLSTRHQAQVPSRHSKSPKDRNGIQNVLNSQNDWSLMSSTTSQFNLPFINKRIVEQTINGSKQKKRRIGPATNLQQSPQAKKNKLELNNSPRLNDAINIYSKPTSINKIKTRFSTKDTPNDQAQVTQSYRFPYSKEQAALYSSLYNAQTSILITTQNSFSDQSHLLKQLGTTRYKVLNQSPLDISSQQQQLVNPSQNNNEIQIHQTLASNVLSFRAAQHADQSKISKYNKSPNMQIKKLMQNKNKFGGGSFVVSVDRTLPQNLMLQSNQVQFSQASQSSIPEVSKSPITKKKKRANQQKQETMQIKNPALVPLCPWQDNEHNMLTQSLDRNSLGSLRDKFGRFSIATLDGLILSSKEAIERIASKKRMINQNDQANESDIDQSPKVDVEIYLRDDMSSSDAEDDGYLQKDEFGGESTVMMQSQGGLSFSSHITKKSGQQDFDLQ